jgi:hypothetical protein
MHLVPWKVNAPVDERMRFLTRLKDGERMTDLCEEFGISRKTGYKFVERFEKLGIVGLLDQRRVPERIPHRTSKEVTELIVTLRRKHPTWGPKKLHEVLRRRHPALRVPVASTIGDILVREKLIVPNSTSVSSSVERDASHQGRSSPSRWTSRSAHDPGVLIALLVLLTTGCRPFLPKLFQPPNSVTHVPGLKCHPCSGLHRTGQRSRDRCNPPSPSTSPSTSTSTST